jgi:hypothetical protein
LVVALQNNKFNASYHRRNNAPRSVKQTMHVRVNMCDCLVEKEIKNSFCLSCLNTLEIKLISKRKKYKFPTT